MRNSHDDGQKSRSTVAHMSSHIRDFLSWLLKLDRFEALPKDLADYMQLPRAALQKGIGRQQRQYPDLDEAEMLLRRMPKQTATDRRARAMFALTFLAALRADTVTSLRIKHVDVDAGRVLQDASVTRTKNGKSLEIGWFPVPPSFSDETADWLAWLSKKGFGGEDALLPEAAILHAGKSKQGPVDPMSSKHAVDVAFRTACVGHVQRYSPHAARHTIKAEMDKRPLTMEQRKASLSDYRRVGHQLARTAVQIR